MKKHMTINGIEFTIEKPLERMPSSNYYNRDLMDCYERPSIYKKEIWESWLKWASELPGFCQLGVLSYNYSFFTIGGVWHTEDGKKYVLYITKTRHEIHEVIQLVEQIVCVVIVMTSLIIIVSIALVVSVIRLKYIKDTAQEAIKEVKGKASHPNTFSEDTIRKYVREEIIKMMK